MAAVDSRTNVYPIDDFVPARLAYRWSADAAGFTHNFERDLQLLILWERSRAHEKEILEQLEASFTIFGIYEVEWSDRHLITNFNRFYGKLVGLTSSKHLTVGGGAFLLVVVEDPRPLYRYHPNVSGAIELTNVNIASFKQLARATAGPGYTVHSSNSLEEFFHDATLVLGPSRVASVVGKDRSPSGHVERLTVDLCGADGWRDERELFEVLNWTTRYVVLRGFEPLPRSEPLIGGEVDVLCKDPRQFAAAANAFHAGGGGSSAGHRTVVAGRSLKIDVRYVGDGYFDALWQDRILERAALHAGVVRVPRIDDHFFSLLYHAKIQKPTVKPEYRNQLPSLARSVGIPRDLAVRIHEDAPAAKVLSGYLSSHGYRTPKPVDRGVHRNVRFARILRSRSFRQRTTAPTVGAKRRLRHILGRVPYLRRSYRWARTAWFG